MGASAVAGGNDEAVTLQLLSSQLNSLALSMQALTEQVARQQEVMQQAQQQIPVTTGLRLNLDNMNPGGLTPAGSSPHFDGSPLASESGAEQRYTGRGALESMAAKALDSGLTDAEVHEAREMFELADRDNSGSIDVNELQEILRLLGMYDMTLVDVEQLIIDTNEEGGDIHACSVQAFLEVYSLCLRSEHIDQHTRHAFSEISFYSHRALMRWVHDDGEEVAGNVTGSPLVPPHRRLARNVAMSKTMENVFNLAIFVSAISSGLGTYDYFEGGEGVYVAEMITLGVFVIEVVSKIVAETGKCSSYLGWLADPWNSFDFLLLLVLVALEVSSRLEADRHQADNEGPLRALRMLRLMRAVRILRVAKMMPELIHVLETVVRSAKSVAYIGIFMLVLTYMFGIIGASLFGKNDPFHFGNLGLAMMSLFRIATLEDWTDIMYYQTYGCEGWGDYQSITVHRPGMNGTMVTVACEHEAFSWISPVFFVTFVMLSAFFVLNLFVGIVVNSSISAATDAEARKREADEWAMSQRLKQPPDNPLGSGLELAGKSLRKLPSITGVVGLPGSSGRNSPRDVTYENPLSDEEREEGSYCTFDRN